MNKKDWIEGLLFAGFRLMAVALIIIGLLSLLFQLINSWSAFDPSYLWPFLASTILRPSIVILTGLLLMAISNRLAHSMAKRHKHS